MIYIQTSLDWGRVQMEIEAPAHKLNHYSHEMLHLSKNIGIMVAELSKEEINCRRFSKQTVKHKEMIDKINQEIDAYQSMITFGLLLNA